MQPTQQPGGTSGVQAFSQLPLMCGLMSSRAGRGQPGDILGAARPCARRQAACVPPGVVSTPLSVPTWCGAATTTGRSVFPSTVTPTAYIVSRLARRVLQPPVEGGCAPAGVVSSGTGCAFVRSAPPLATLPVSHENTGCRFA